MSINPTGSKTAETNDGQLDASDLLGDDGCVDVDKIRAVTHEDRQQSFLKVTAEQATYIRQQLFRGRTLRSLSHELELSQPTISRHAKETNLELYQDGESPDCPPVEYNGGEWRYVDE